MGGHDPQRGEHASHAVPVSVQNSGELVKYEAEHFPTPISKWPSVAGIYLGSK